MSIRSLGIEMEGQDTIEFHASRSEPTAWIVLDVDGSQCEIQLAQSHVETLRDQLPGVLADLARVGDEDDARQRADDAVLRATDAVTRALEKARLAENTGAHEVATSLRTAAAETTETADAVDRAVRTFVEATLSADRAADRLAHATVLAGQS
ncbi:hypothetical protein BLA60_37665 [Actinophytocola xinjiangensis]|uniref:Uncharacterized protein n=1 Tax=Actinophytocola xinjiangensis TaxID=485602 RepID=A0A7Z0WFH0_9PSEU|nr:hypothetical protein [Actinophytocola xinjiangensis]OLF05110.1 hypothetical protein BLA60_37665 [Actinophytocola xinjiangensis]